jgi:putative ABC transport system substrate-binding protein
VPQGLGFTESFRERGALIGYGPSVPALYQRAAYYVQQVLASVRPAELPIEQPTKFNLIISLKTASALGLSVPGALPALADQVIE